MRDGFKVIDADRHVLEPSDLFEKYLPAKFREPCNIEGPNQSVVAMDGEPISDADKMRPTVKQEDYGFTFAASKRWRETFADALAAKFDAASNMRDMDREGVDVSVLFPDHRSLYHVARQSRSGAERRHLPRLQHLARRLLQLRSQTALRRMPDSAAGSGARGGRAEVRAKKNSAWWASSGGPTSSAAARSRAPTIIRSMRPPRTSASPSASTKARAPCSNKPARTATANSAAISPAIRWNRCSPVFNFCADGVLEKFPKLKVAHLESGCGWVPFWLERMDEHWEHEGHGQAKTTKEKPSYLFQTPMLGKLRGGRRAGAGVYRACRRRLLDDRHRLSAQRLHRQIPRSDRGRSHQATINISHEARRKILWDNPVQDLMDWRFRITWLNFT